MAWSTAWHICALSLSLSGSNSFLFPSIDIISSCLIMSVCRMDWQTIARAWCHCSGLRLPSTSQPSCFRHSNVVRLPTSNIRDRQD